MVRSVGNTDPEYKFKRQRKTGSGSKELWKERHSTREV